MPPLSFGRATPAVIIPTAIGCVFQGMTESINPMLGFVIPKDPGWTPPPADAHARGRKRAGRITLSPIVLMSSGRLFLDRVGRHQSPSPLRRRDQNNSLARSNGTIYHRTVTSVLTGCLTFRDKRT